jgi:hypothetical protein
VPEVSPPFRWDLVAPDRLGSLLDGAGPPDLWFVDDLAECAGKVLARSGHGDLLFVGRSLDSVFDLLSGALAGARGEQRLARLPFSFARPGVGAGRGWHVPALTVEQRSAARDLLADAGLAPAALARRTRPATFVDIVAEGSTFTELFTLLDDWIAEEGAPRDVVRRKLRFVGVTPRKRTSPNTWRWQQHAGWTDRLPGTAVRNVPLDLAVWSYLGGGQPKLTRTYRPADWVVAPADDTPADDADPDRADRTRRALAEAVALVEHGRSRAGRRRIARAIAGEPALSEPWLRTLAHRLTTAA